MFLSVIILKGLSFGVSSAAIMNFLTRKYLGAVLARGVSGSGLTFASIC